ncbi:MAG: AgmX/PglI C-terminal domain-containing protein [Proteobacteria bacterium]|nr:AgmX/PglI C-terminal domain-containing protein [Pseudomonadota bacterium]MCP4915472.1 AgmX/PglI C-terminal domain-containing protein [Pseudomonadota bacterium]
MIWLTSALAATPGEADAAPTGRYLTSPEVHAQMLEQLPTVAACYEHSTEARARTELGDVYVTFVIRPDGTVSDAVVHETDSGLPELDRCIVEAVGTLVFRSHDEDRVDVGYPFIWLDARLQPYPMVYVKERGLDPMFLYLPADSALIDELRAD